MNFVDKIVSVFSPQAALNRIGARKRLEILNSGYGNYGASHTKKSLLGWLYHGGSANEDIQENLSTLRQRSRDLYAGVPLATSAIKTMRTNVVGTGLTLKSQIDYEFLGMTEEQAEELESTIEREFALFEEECDIERFDNFAELQQLAFANWLLSGDVIALLPHTKRVGVPYDLRIQLVESDRVCTPLGKELDPHFIGGVETNNEGETVAYHVLNIHPLSFSTEEPAPEWTRVKAFGEKTGRRNVIHIMNRERIGQRRGVPFLAPVVEALKQLGRYMDAELVAAVVSGMFAVFIQKSDNSADGSSFGEVVPESEQVSTSDNDIEIGNGSIIDLEEGETANAVSPGRPNANFDGFVIAISRQIGAALEIPYELLIKNFTASYSASRGALLEAWKAINMYRNWLAKDFCQPIYEEWLAEAVAKGRIIAPGFFSDVAIRKAYSGAEWNGPSQGLLNPVQEVQAAELRVNNGFSTRAREAREINGSDFYKNARQRRREESIMREVNGNVRADNSTRAVEQNDNAEKQDNSENKSGQPAK